MTVPSKNLFQSLPSVPKKSIQNTATGEGYRAIRIQRKFQVTQEGERETALHKWTETKNGTLRRNRDQEDT